MLEFYGGGLGAVGEIGEIGARRVLIHSHLYPQFILFKIHPPRFDFHLLIVNESLNQISSRIESSLESASFESVHVVGRQQTESVLEG